MTCDLRFVPAEVVVEDGSDLNFEETAAGIDLPGIRRSTRVRVPTERGLDYQLPLCKNRLISSCP